MKYKKDNFATNAFFQGLTGLISKIGSLIFTIILARMLLPELFGLYSLALTIILTLITITDFGLGVTTTRYLADSKNQKIARSRFLFLFNIRVILAFLVSLVLFFIAPEIASFYKNPNLILPLKIGALYLFLTSIYALIGPVLLALQKLKYNAVTEALFQFFRIFLVLIFLFYYKTIESVFLALSLATFFALSFVIYFVFIKNFPFLFKGEKEPVERKRMISFSSFILLGSMGMLIFSNIDKLFLGYFVSPEFIGYYTIMMTLVLGIFGFFSFTSVLFPKFTEIEKADLKEVFHNSIKYLSIISFPATFGLAYLFLPFINLIYGSIYVPAEHYSVLFFTAFILAFLLLEGILTPIYKMLFNAKEQAKIPAFTTFSSAILNIILNFIFISYFIKFSMAHALFGAALATIISRYADLFVLIVIIKHKLGISSEIKTMIKPFVASIIMLFFLIMVRPYFSQWTLLILILLSAILYFFVLYLIKGIKKEEATNFFREISTFCKIWF